MIEDLAYRDVEASAWPRMGPPEILNMLPPASTVDIPVIWHRQAVCDPECLFCSTPRCAHIEEFIFVKVHFAFRRENEIFRFSDWKLTKRGWVTLS